ncbi:GNAT family N-acetyltransferase [Alkalinema pantanalense CENA528]|uniref:GNAT family N-acetyltransferase n=1 Tax=Alkalinema pantanalense TaxID=1620705 RepID=UPI003D6EF2C0
MIETSRLILRPLTEDDFIPLCVLFADPAVMQYVGDGQPRSPQSTTKYLQWVIDHQKQYGFSLLAVIRKSDNRWIGQCGLWHLEHSEEIETEKIETEEIELGYKFMQDCWGQGYATEASLATLDYGFTTLALDRICAIAQPANRASQRVLHKVGMHYEKTGQYYGQTCVYYAVNRDQWNAGNKASAS